jgi:hypothetical protein
MDTELRRRVLETSLQLWHAARVSSDGAEPMVANTTLLDLVTIVARHARSEAETIATVMSVVNQVTFAPVEPSRGSASTPTFSAAA